MDADLDLLLTAVYVTADDLLPRGRGTHEKRHRRGSRHALRCAIMGIPSDRRFLAVAAKHLRHLFPRIPGQAGYYKRRRRLADTLEWLMGVFASQSPGIEGDLLLLDSTPVECARSRDGQALPVGRRRRLRVLGQPQPLLLGLRLHALCSPDGTTRAIARPPPSSTSAMSRSRRRSHTFSCSTAQGSPASSVAIQSSHGVPGGSLSPRMVSLTAGHQERPKHCQATFPPRAATDSASLGFRADLVNRLADQLDPV
jgi:hypothetical protein